MASNSYSLTGRIKGSAPPAQPGIETEVVRITSTVRRHFYLLSPEPWGAYWHWSNGSLECREPEKCERCEVSMPRKWRAYIHALETIGTSQQSVILEITQTATVMIDVQLCTQPYRGAYVVMNKTAGGKHGRFVVEMMPRRIDPITLPIALDPAPIMKKLWALNEKKRSGKVS